MSLDKFKGETGQWLTRALFFDRVVKTDTGPADYSRCLYYLSDNPDPTNKRISLKQEFLKLGDVTGYKLAQKYLASYEHFKILIEKTPWFAEEFNLWVEELALKLKHEALERIKEISEEGSAQSLGASKYLANEEYNTKVTKVRGRPSKEEIAGELKKEAKVASQTIDDFKRMTGLSVVQGGKK